MPGCPNVPLSHATSSDLQGLLPSRVLSGVTPHWFASQRSILESPYAGGSSYPWPSWDQPLPWTHLALRRGADLGGSPCPWPVVATNTSQPLPSKGKAVPKEAVVCPVPSSWQFWCSPEWPCLSLCVNMGCSDLLDTEADPQMCRCSSHGEELD